ncbi:hypothetical protein C0J52_04815, partial [Blattella germanica]
VLEFKHKQLDDTFHNTTEFTISDCPGTIVFNKDAFKEFYKLENLRISNAYKVVMEPDVFQSLDILTIKNVQEVEFKSRAFQDAYLKRVGIYQSNMKKLPQFSFYNVESLEKFHLLLVKIGEVESNAIYLKNTSTVHMTNTTVDKIGSQGIKIEAEHVTLDYSDFKGLEDDAITLTVSKQLDILRNKVEFNSANIPIVSEAQDVNISNNHFNFLSKDIVSQINSNKRFIFLNNIIDKFESDEPLEEVPENWDARENKFQCTCEFLQIFKNVTHSSLVKNNFCKRSCKMSLKHAAEKCSRNSTASFDDKNVCKVKLRTTSQGSKDFLTSFNSAVKPSTATVTNLGLLLWTIMTPWFLRSTP